MSVKPIPDGYHAITPYYTVENVAVFMGFIKKAFNAVEIYRMGGPDGSVMHADLMIGDSHLMTGAAKGEWKAMPLSVYLYVEDCDATYKRAIEAGATSLREPYNEFYGDRSAGVLDPFGNMWWLATHVEDVSEEEMEKRAEEWMKSMEQ